MLILFNFIVTCAALFLMLVSNGIVHKTREVGDTMRSRLAVVACSGLSLFLAFTVADLDGLAFKYGDYILPIMLLVGFIAATSHNLLEAAKITGWARLAVMTGYMFLVYGHTLTMFGDLYDNIMLIYSIYFVYHYAMLEDDLEEQKYHRDNSDGDEGDW